MIFTTEYANARQLIAWVLGFGGNLRISGPPELLAEMRERVRTLVTRHSGDPDALLAASEASVDRPPARAPRRRRGVRPLPPPRTPAARSRSARSASRGWSRSPRS